MKRLIFLFVLTSVTHAAYSITPDDSSFFFQYWKAGELDPTRKMQWPQSAVYEDKLVYLPVSPQYVSYISEGDRYDPSDYFYIEPRYNSDGTLPIAHIKSRGSDNTHHDIILFIDLGRVLPGTIEFEADPPEGVSIRFETGEAQMPKQKYEVNTLPNGTKKKFGPQIDHGGWAGMRYVWIRFENIKEPFTLYSLNGIYQVRPSNYVGDFDSDDDMLNRIWEMCAFSAHAVMGQPVRSDSIPQPVLQTLCMDRSDRDPWVGDSRVIQTAVGYVFGEYELLRRANERLIPKLQWIPPYCLDWGLAEIDYFWISGNSEHFVKRLDKILALLDEFDPSPTPKEGWYFFDWDHRIMYNPTQEQAAFWGKYVQLCRETAQAAQVVGKSEVADKLNLKAEAYALQWKKEHPNGQNEYDIHAITNLVLGGVLKDYAPIYDRVYANRVKRCTQTPYFGIYVVRALTMMGRLDKAVELVRDYWGTMIQAGATSTWEEWLPTWQIPVGSLPPQYDSMDSWSGSSLNQPAGAGPAQWLLSEVIGIKPASPGFGNVRIEPYTADLKRAKGTVASPLGAISAAWEIKGHEMELSFDAPKDCKSVTVVLPKGKKYSLDNKKITPQTIIDGKAYFNVSSGSHSVKVRFI
jgi:hypothetical protein